MDNDSISGLMNDGKAQDLVIKKTVNLISKHDMDGVNIDFEYVGNPGQEMRDKFTRFVEKMTDKVHQYNVSGKVTVSVYAGSMKDPKIYDIARIAKVSDGIFMMAYDFATRSSNQVIPTAPLYGHKEGKYWYDISTAVEDFLKVMPAEKLILGLPWYGYNYPVTEPGVKVDRYKGYYYTYWWRRRKYTAFQSVPSSAQTYAIASKNTTEMTGWDDYGKVGWLAYREGGVWRMIFLDDVRSLKIKYDFAKEKRLGGVGMWALGFDSGTSEMWDLLSREFGGRIADTRSGN
jgi:spore germination protein YaaH